MSEKIYKLLITLICGVIFFILCASAIIVYISFDLPDVKQLAHYAPPVHSQIFSREGKVLLTIGKEKREMVDLKKIPKKVIDAFLASEDANFFEHHGVDYFGILRALLADIRAGKIVQGGSTITQQVAKALFLSNQKSVARKLKDILLAQKIEQVFTKEEILTLYLNHVYFGGGYYGVKSAFKGHFDKELKDITHAEAALLAGLLVAPSRYSPYVNEKHAQMRQRYVLGRMLDTGRISKKDYAEAMKEEIRVRLSNFDSAEKISAGHFVDWVRQRIIELVGEEAFLTSGLKITTTLDWELQQRAEKAILGGVRELDKRQGFKGPLKHLGSNEEIREFIKKSRQKYFEKNSKFFKINSDGERVYEIDFDESEFLALEREYEKNKINKDLDHFWPGLADSKDRIHDFLKTGEVYEAVVEKVNDPQKLIYISIAGTKGIIPLQYFRWAHKRKISEFATSAYNYINTPSDILKKGDVILVKINDKQKSPWDCADEKYKKNLISSHSKDNLITSIKNEKFYLCELEQEPEVEGALVAIQNQTGDILAMVGGVDFSRSQYNRVIQSSRQPGSSFKPLIYAAALENGYTPATVIVDSPEALSGADDTSVWKPKNYDGEFEGPITLRHALEGSRNIPAVKMAVDVGIQKIITFCERIGLDTSKINPDLSFALGPFGASLFNLTSTYTVFPNLGKRIFPKSISSIVDRHGKQYFLNEKALSPHSEKSENSEQVYDSRHSYVMVNLLRGVVQHGTAASARELGPNIGGKTGTTNDYVDAWFVGFSANVTTGVWTGFDNNETLGYGETGTKAALPIWKEFMRKALQKYGEQSFSIPPGIVHVNIDKHTGKLATETTEAPFAEAFVAGTEPGRSSFVSNGNFVIYNGGATDHANKPTNTPALSTATETAVTATAASAAAVTAATASAATTATTTAETSAANTNSAEIIDDDYYLNQ
ncbi:MAG: PBP1A family penicillin-binding protein [Oligoflexia bacterium]|nr:PBP1A family penicillin-binding protein [Oligoflexia bacterium]